MYQLTPKRKELIKRSAVYAFMTLTVVTGVTGFMFYILGYQFNGSDGKIEQGGLVQFESKPGNGTIAIDNSNDTIRTPNKATLTAGKHTITIQKDGYASWHKSVDVVRGSVLWLNYARLVPSKLTSSKVADFTTVSSATSSPDDKWIAIKEDPATPSIRLANISGDKVAMTTLELPTSSYTHRTSDVPDTFTLQNWDPDSRYILVKHTYDDKSEWIVVDSRDAAATKNITTLLTIDAAKPVFSNKDSRVMYALVGTDIRRLDIGQATISGPLVRNVAEFSLYDTNTIAYTSLLDGATNQRVVGYFNDGASKSRIIGVYNGPQPLLHVAIDNYSGQTYVVVTSDEKMEIMSGSLPSSDSSSLPTLKVVATVKVAHGTAMLSTKTKGRFVVSQNETAFTIYDLELSKTTTTKLVGDAKITGQMQWIDEYHIWNDQAGMLRLYEFDGANQHAIMPVVNGLSAAISPNDTYLYGFTMSSDGVYHLSRVRMIL